MTYMQYINKRAPQEGGGYATYAPPVEDDGNLGGNTNDEGTNSDIAVSSGVSEVFPSTVSTLTTTTAAATVTRPISASRTGSVSASLPTVPIQSSSIQSVLSSIMSQTPSPTLPVRSSITMMPSSSISSPLLPKGNSSGSSINNPNSLLLFSVMAILFVRLFIKN